MTLSVTRRKDAVREALGKMVTILGDGHRNTHHFCPDEPTFEDVLATTWRELLDADMIERRSRDSYVLTARGWLTGLRLNGRLTSEETRERAVVLVRALKAKVKGRGHIHDHLIDVRDLASETGLPVTWLWNALDARLLEKTFPKDRMNVRLDRSLVKIPPTFGMDPVGID